MKNMILANLVIAAAVATSVTFGAMPVGAFWYRMILPFVLIFACAAVARGVRRFEGLKV